MLVLGIQVRDTFGFRIGMWGKENGLLVEITKHQGKMISLKLQKFTGNTRFAFIRHELKMNITCKNKWASLHWALFPPPRNNKRYW